MLAKVKIHGCVIHTVPLQIISSGCKGLQALLGFNGVFLVGVSACGLGAVDLGLPWHLRLCCRSLQEDICGVKGLGLKAQSVGLGRFICACCTTCAGRQH